MLLATSGIVVAKHYCSGKWMSTSFYAAEACCGMDAPCCHTEVEWHKVDEKVDMGAKFTLPVLQLVLSAILPEITTFQPQFDVENDRFRRYRPPPDTPRLRTQLQIFRI
ncbi:MAG: hypothetical protein AAF570_04505 [Bacteroidota bacterium]